jgi:hypothetical protein
VQVIFAACREKVTPKRRPNISQTIYFEETTMKEGDEGGHENGEFEPIVIQRVTNQRRRNGASKQLTFGSQLRWIAKLEKTVDP